MEHWPIYVFLGLSCGVFSATFGVGSGIILVPVLVLLFHFPQKSAQGICLAVMAPMALVGTFRYWRNPQIQIDLGVAAWLTLGAVVGAVIGAWIAGMVPGPALRRLFAAVLLFAAVRMMIVSPKNGGAPPLTPVDTTESGASTDNGDP